MKKHTKKVFVEGLGLVDDHFSGIGQYILGILRGLDNLLDEKTLADDQYEVSVIIPFDRVDRFRAFGFRNLRCYRLPISSSFLSGLVAHGLAPPLDLFCGKGAYVFPRFTSMPLLWSRSAAVIHDLSFELHKDYCDTIHATFLSHGVRKTLKNTEKVVAVSNNARRELIGFYGLRPEDVSVATPAADLTHFYPRDAEEIASVKARYGVEGDYILALSNLEPRKNLEMLVDVYCQLPKAFSDKVGLLIVGAVGWKSEALLMKILERVEQGHNISRPTSYVLDEHKPALISGATMLVYPSHYEGFGIPPLEALACGVPVITADNSSMPEVVGQVGHLVPSDRPDALRAAIISLLENLESETKLARAHGPRQAANFDWTKSARVFLDIADELNLPRS